MRSQSWPEATARHRHCCGYAPLTQWSSVRRVTPASRATSPDRTAAVARPSNLPKVAADGERQKGARQAAGYVMRAELNPKPGPRTRGQAVAIRNVAPAQNGGVGVVCVRLRGVRGVACV